MNFNATFNVTGFIATGIAKQFSITAQVVDNTSLYSSLDVAVGNYIFVNGTQNGNPLVMIYHVDTIVDDTTPPSLTVLATYIGPETGPFDPVGESLIAAPNESGLIDIPDASTFQLSTLFVNAVRNYEIDSLTASVHTTQDSVATVQSELDAIPTDIMETRIYDPANTGTITGDKIGVVDGGSF